MEFFTAFIDWIVAYIVGNPAEVVIIVAGGICAWIRGRSLGGRIDKLEKSNKLLHCKQDTILEILKSNNSAEEKVKQVSAIVSTGRPEVSISVGVVKPEKNPKNNL